MKRLAIVAAVLFIAAAACRAEREDAMVDTAPDMAPPPAMMDTMPMDTMPMGDTAVMR